MKNRVSKFTYPLTLLILVICLWQYFSTNGLIAFWIIPSPLCVFRVFVDKYSLLLFHLRYTLQSTLIGFTLSLLIGIGFALIMDASKVARKSLYPYMVISQTIPIIAVAPLIIVWLGYGISSKVFTVLLTCFFPITLNFFDGLSGVSIDKIRLLKSMGAGKARTLWLLKIPEALPNLFTGLKIAATYSIMGAIIGEWLGGSGGLGIYMTRAAKSFNIDEVFAVILVIIIVSLSFFYAIKLAEQKLLNWINYTDDEYMDIQ